MTNDKTSNIQFHTQSSMRRGTLTGKLSHGSARQNRFGTAHSQVLPPELLHKLLPVNKIPIKKKKQRKKNEYHDWYDYTTQIPIMG